MSTFINLSNHPSAAWGEAQKAAALQYGELVDVQFPVVDPHASREQVEAQAEALVAQILEYQPVAVMCQGEFTLVYAVVNLLKHKGILTLAGCSDRLVEERDGKRISEFVFVQFREY